MSTVNTDSLSLANLLRPEVRADPYPLFRQIRETDPVHWDAPMGFWSVTRYADMAAALHDTRFAKAQGFTAVLSRLSPEARRLAEPVYEVFGRQMLYADPPYHTRLRNITNRAFTPAVAEAMRERIERIVDELLDAAQPDGRMDIIAGLAFPLPIRVIMEVIGLPPERRADYKRWSDHFAASLGLVRREAQVFEQAADSLAEITADIRALHAQRQVQPENDLLTAFVHLEQQDDRLTLDELVANTILLLAAGHETTTNLMGNAVLALLRHPDQMQVLRDEPALTPNAVDELMRYDNGVQIVWRVAAEDLELGGQTIAAGQFVNVLLGAANRDPAQFPDPDRLDLRRKVSRQAGFGLGAHFCQGAPLARLEMQIAIGRLAQRWPGLRLATGDLEWQESPTFRGLKSLPVLLN